MRRHSTLTVWIVLLALMLSPATSVVFAHVGSGSHQHAEGDPNDVTWTDVADSWAKFFAPVIEPVRTTIAWFVHVTYDEPAPYYTVSDIGGGFYRCSCGASYSYYDSHSH